METANLAAELIGDALVAPFTNDRFRVDDFVSQQINSRSDSELVELIAQLRTRERSVDEFFTALCNANPEFVNNQFDLADKMAPLFDSLGTTLQQNKRRAAQTREILNFNAEQLRTLADETRALRALSDELRQVETLNDMLIELSVYLKRGLLWDSAELLRRVDVKARLFEAAGRESAALAHAGEYFARQLKIKREEMFYVLREELHSFLYEGLVQRVDVQSFNLLASVQGRTAPDFLSESPLYEFFEDGVLGDFVVPLAESDLCALHARLAADRAARAPLIAFLFDGKVFDALRADLNGVFPAGLKHETRLLEVIASARESVLLERLFGNFAVGAEAKLPLFLAKTLRFFLFTAANHRLWPGAESLTSESVPIDRLARVSFGAHFCRSLAIFIHRTALMLKAGEQRRAEIAFNAFEKSLEHFKHAIERLLAPATRKSADELSLALKELGVRLQLTLSDCVVLVAQFCTAAADVVAAAAALLELPHLSAQLLGLVDLLEQYLVGVFTSRLQKSFDTQVATNRGLEELVVSEARADESAVLSSAETAASSAYNVFLLQKRLKIEFYDAHRPFLRSLATALSVGGRSFEASAPVFALTNKLLGRVVEASERRLLRNSAFLACEDLELPFWNAWRADALSALGLGAPTALGGETRFARAPSERFWLNGAALDFYERAFVAFAALYEIFAEQRVAFALFWSALPSAAIDSLSESLNGTALSFENALAASRGDSRRKRTSERSDFVENCLSSLAKLASLGELLSRLLAFLKYNFDLLLNDFFAAERVDAPLRFALASELATALGNFERIYARRIAAPSLAALFANGSLRLFGERLCEYVSARAPIEQNVFRRFFGAFREAFAAVSPFRAAPKEFEALAKCYENLREKLSIPISSEEFGDEIPIFEDFLE